MNSPDATRAVNDYRRLAACYETATRRAAPVRARTVAALDLRPGDTVLDVACGTGVCFPLVQEKIGPTGRIIGVELSPEMLALAKKRVQAAGWSNVELIQASIQAARIPVQWDAAVFHFTHDVLRSKVALANIFSKAKPGARVALAGTKLFPWWLMPLNLYIWIANWSYMTTFEGLSAPWSLLKRDFIPGLEIVPIWLGASYVARGVYRK